MSLGSFMDMISVTNIGVLPGQGTHHTDTWPGFGKKLTDPLREPAPLEEGLAVFRAHS